MESYCGIPVVDVDESLPTEEVSRCLVSALRDVGFAYIKNSGITQKELDATFKLSARFFDLPIAVKMLYKFPTEENKRPHTFVPPENERFDNLLLDVKEALDLVNDDDYVWPSQEHVPGFKKAVSDFESSINTLGYRILSLIIKGLKCENPDLLRDLFERGDSHIFRLVDYPKIADLSELEPGQMRCSAHTDYGGFTILFQDDCGGLQVMNREGEYVDALPLAGTALINIGDFLAMCSNGQLKSTCHRVLVSEKNFQKRRQSIVYFFDPDGNKMVQPESMSGDTLLPGPICYNMWRNKRFQDTRMLN
ncbi:uncharacterized protein [Watersipora subatra]|uniref:uncharacterized protein n=1 Tax=Watersipora subatra TaxID=2589382 RepID=UPI00355C6347